MTALVRFVAVLVGAAAVGLMGVLLGAWWAPFVAGLGAGALLPRARWAILAGAISGVAAWGIPLESMQLQYGLRATTLALAAIMGYNGAATIPVALTLLIGLLLGLTGSWLGAAVRSVVRTDTPRPATKVVKKKVEPQPQVASPRA